MIPDFSKLRSAPLDFGWTGNYDYSSGLLYGATAYGSFWPRTARSTESAYFLYFSNGSVSAQDYNSRGYGLALRCTAK